MAETLPLNFPVPQSSAIASYDFTDIEEGVGHVEFYLSTDKDTGGTDYLITRYAFYSYDVVVSQTFTAQANYDWTFDAAVLNMPRIIYGTAIFNFNTSIERGAGPEMSSGTWKILLYKWDGSTATQIGSTWESETVSTTGAEVRTMISAKITCPVTKLKKGENVRIVIRFTSTGNITEETTIRLCVDPQNRDSDPFIPSADPNEFTTNTALIPFRIQT